jgi:methionine aminotransferase
MKEFLKVHQYNSFCCFSPVQYALAKFLENKTEYLSLGIFLQKKRDYFQEIMRPTRFEPVTSSGSYFQLYSYSRLSNESEMDFAKKLIIEAGVATIPVSAFYKTPVENHVLRFCFAKKEATLQEAARRLLNFDSHL